MKILEIKSNKFKTFLKSINLLDGQRRGEVVFRRVFILIVGFLLLYLFLLVVVGKKDDITQGDVPEKAYANEQKVEWVDGNKVITESDGSVKIIPKEVFMSKEQLELAQSDALKIAKIEKYLRVNRGNAPLAKYAAKFVEVAKKYEIDYRLLPAISVMESGGGKSNFRSYNAWGWGKKGFSSFEEGIETVGRGLRNGYMDKGADTVDKMAPIYCPPNATNWARNVKQFMNEIETMEVK